MSISQGRRVGNIHFQNFLKRFIDYGFNFGDCVSELIDNSLDAECTIVKIILDKYLCDDGSYKYFLYVIDDGKGMDIDAFEKFFEMYADKDNLAMKSLGKKGIGGKVALVSLSQLSETVMISKRETDDILFVLVPWDTITEPKSITVQSATRMIEEIWDKYAINISRGTISRISLQEHVFDSLDEIINKTTFEPRNIYALSCRNYFRFINNNLKISFEKPYGEQYTLICKPIDPLYYKQVPDNHKQQDILKLFKDPDDGNKFVFLQRTDNGSYIGYRENTKNVSQVSYTDTDVEKFELIVEVSLEHTYLDWKHECSILEEIFDDVKEHNTSQVTWGTHLERNNKETGILISATRKLSGDHDKRKYYAQSRHRLSFDCSADNNDIVDKLFRTQINKSKVDINDIPKIVHKMVEMCNNSFVTKIINMNKTEKSQEENIKTCATNVTPDVTHKQKSSNTNVNIHNELPTNLSTMRSETLTSNKSGETIRQLLDNLPKTQVPSFTRNSPISQNILLDILIKYRELLRDESNVDILREKSSRTSTPGYTKLANELASLYEHFKTLLNE
jgi:hypothetical protein